MPDPTPPRQLTPDEQLEYREIGEFLRHENTLVYQMAAVVLPLSFGALPLAVEKPWPIKIGLAVFSAAIFLHWVATAERLAWFMTIRQERAREIERLGELAHHSRIDTADHEDRRKVGLARLRIRPFRIYGLTGVLAISWVFVFVYQPSRPAPPPSTVDTVYVAPAGPAPWRVHTESPAPATSPRPRKKPR